MADFEYTTTLPYPREEVFAWFTRPGALPRLSPPFAGSVLQEPDRGIEVGSMAVLGLGVPGELGLGISGALGTIAGALGAPGAARAEVRWRARHTQLDPGRSFTDVMASGPLRSWEHHHHFDAAPAGRAGTVMTDRIEFELPLPAAVARFAGRRPGRWAEDRFARELTRMFQYRERQLLADLSFHDRHRGAALTVAVAGSSGAIGTQVCALLAGGGHRVIRLVRRPARTPNEIAWDPGTGTLDPSALAACDAVVNVGGSPLGRFTPANKERMFTSRIRGTALLARTLAGLAADGRARTLVNASGIGYYGATPHAEAGSGATGDRRDKARGAAGEWTDVEPLTEESPAGADFMAGLCRAWEAACDPAEHAGVRVVHVRTGIGQWPGGTMLQRFLPLYVAGLGGPLAGNAWHSWIGIDDIVGIYAHAVLDSRVTGPVNAVAPTPVTAREYAATLGRVLHRPAAVPVPEFGPRLLLGREGARELAAADQRVSSAKVEAAGYDFRHGTLEPALRHVLGRP